MLHDNKAVRKAAEERMERLYELAYKKNLEGRDEELERKYVRMAKSISSHYKISMPKTIKRSICNNCSTVLIPGKTCRVRLASSKGYLSYICRCGHENKIFYKGRKTI
jgi:RNase P subunit RPR2